MGVDEQHKPRAKKSVALSGTAAGNTAICTVGRTGNDLHYRGYDILDLARQCEFEEVAYLIVHGKLPSAEELECYKSKLRSLRNLPQAVKIALEQIPSSAHPMDVMRTGCSVLGTCLPEKDDHNKAGAKNIVDRLMASFGSILLYWYHYAVNGKRIELETDDDSIGGHFLHLLHGQNPPKSWVKRCPVPLVPCVDRNMVVPMKPRSRFSHAMTHLMKLKQIYANAYPERKL